MEQPMVMIQQQRFGHLIKYLFFFHKQLISFKKAMLGQRDASKLMLRKDELDEPTNIQKTSLFDTTSSEPNVPVLLISQGVCLESMHIFACALLSTPRNNPTHPAIALAEMLVLLAENELLQY
jgi:hypothetical protein